MSTTTVKTYSANFCEKHYNELKASAISDSIIEKNFRTIEDSREVDRLLNRNTNRRWKHSDQLVPCWCVTGLDPRGWERIENGVQIKPDTPPVDENGKVQKYIGASKQDVAPLFLETDDPDYWYKVMKDVSQAVFKTEGAKKAGCGLSHGYATISIPGVSTCRKLGRLHPDLKLFAKFGRTEYLVFDNDAMTKKPVQKGLLGMGLELRALGVKVMVVELPPGDAKGMDDFISQHGKEEFDKLVDSALTIEEYKQKLERIWQQDNQESEKVKQDEREELLVKQRKGYAVLNAVTEVVQETYGDVFTWNELTLNVEIDGKVIPERDFIIDVIHKCKLRISDNDIKLITYMLAKRNSYHPAREYLNEVSETYSNTEIIESLSQQLFNTTEPLYDVMVKKWLIAAVARVMQPGCKMDDVLILGGKQGALKSTFFNVLGGGWYSDNCQGTGNDKDSLMQLHYSWINELAEFDRFLNKRDASDLKQSLSVQIDRFRVPYGREVEPFPRQFVICGTTNKDEFLIDPTGNRRYWVIPVAVDRIDIDWVEQHRDEIWAAAVHLYNQGHIWHLDSDEKSKHVQLLKPFEISDTWEDYIETYVFSLREVTVAEILGKCLGIEPGAQKRAEQMRVADILKRMGWAKKDRGRKVWVCPEAEVASKVASKVASETQTPANTTSQDFNNQNNNEVVIKVASEVAGSEIPASTTSQNLPATSATFEAKNNQTGSDININSNQNNSVENPSKGSEVAGDSTKNRVQTKSQQPATSFATSGNEPATSAGLEQLAQELTSLVKTGASASEIEEFVKGWDETTRNKVKAKMSVLVIRDLPPNLL